MTDYTIINLHEIEDSVSGRTRSSRGASAAATWAPSTWVSECTRR